MRDDKEIFAPSLEPGYIDAVKYFNKLYSEGLLDQETFTYTKSATQFQAKVINGQVGVYTARNGTTEVLPTVADVKNEWVFAQPFAGPDGTTAWTKRLAGVRTKYGGYITNAATPQEQKVIIRFWDQLYDSEMGLQWIYGVTGEALVKNAEDKWEWDSTVDRTKQTPIYGPMAIMKDWEYDNFTPAETTALVNELVERYLPFVRFTYTTGYGKGTAEDQDEIVALSADLVTFARNTEAKWIANGGIDREYDDYVRKLKEMGIERLIKLQQTALDRFHK